jgi:hypothetical protein
MLAHDALLTSLFAGTPRQSSSVRVIICPNATGCIRERSFFGGGVTHVNEDMY